MKITIKIDCEDHKQLKAHLSAIRQVLNNHDKDRKGQNADYDFGGDGIYGRHAIKVEQDNPVIGIDLTDWDQTVHAMLGSNIETINPTGADKITGISFEEPKTETCVHCNGEGKHKCPDCDGEGIKQDWVECSECHHIWELQ